MEQVLFIFYLFIYNILPLTCLSLRIISMIYIPGISWFGNRSCDSCLVPGGVTCSACDRVIDVVLSWTFVLTPHSPRYRFNGATIDGTHRWSRHKQRQLETHRSRSRWGSTRERRGKACCSYKRAIFIADSEMETRGVAWSYECALVCCDCSRCLSAAWGPPSRYLMSSFMSTLWNVADRQTAQCANHRSGGASDIGHQLDTVRGTFHDIWSLIELEP